MDIGTISAVGTTNGAALDTRSARTRPITDPTTIGDPIGDPEIATRQMCATQPIDRAIATREISSTRSIARKTDVPEAIAKRTGAPTTDAREAITKRTDAPTIDVREAIAKQTDAPTIGVREAIAKRAIDRNVAVREQRVLRVLARVADEPGASTARGLQKGLERRAARLTRPSDYAVRAVGYRCGHTPIEIVSTPGPPAAI